MRRLFLIIFLLATIAAKAGPVTMHYWFDQNYAARDSVVCDSGQWHLLLDVGTLRDGLHTLNLQLGEGASAELRSYVFYKISQADSSVSSLHYDCWFDQDYAALQSGILGTGHFLLDVGTLRDGLHTLNMQLGEGASAELRSYVFYKMSQVDSSVSSLHYDCWFDQDYAALQSGILGTGHFLLDVGTLRDGLHTLNMQLGEGASAELRSYVFYKMSQADSSVSSLHYSCWFDQDYADHQSGTLGTGMLQLEVSQLRDGLHTLNLQLGEGASAELHSYVFYKTPHVQQHFFSLGYTYWFDQDYAAHQSGTLGSGMLLLEVSQLRYGLHTLNLQLGEGASAELRSYVFYKMTSHEMVADTATLHYYYTIDGNQREPIAVQPTGGLIHLNLDVNDVSTGLHTLHCFLMTDDGSSSSIYNTFFYKAPAGGLGVKRYEYCLNGDFNNMHTYDFPPQDTLQLITLLPVDSLPIRSMCFEFNSNNGSPVIYSKNDITFRFWNTEQRFVEATRQYVDERVMQMVVADTLEHDTTKVIPAPTNNAIHWFKLAAGTGDSLSFHTDRRCTIQLYAPSGEMVFHTSGDTVLTWHGCHAWEDGDYYLAVHDAEGSGSMSVSYQWIYRYAVLAWDVHRVGNGGISTITFEGNGFNSLDTVYLVKGTDTISAMFLNRESNTTVGVFFNFEGTDTGMYNAAFVYVDETLPVHNTVWVETALPIVLTSNVSYPSTFLRGSTVTYTYEITNTGNMTAYNVPLYTYIGSSTLNGVSHIKYNGLSLPSIIDGIDVDSLSVDEITKLQEWAEEVGDDHYFFKLRAYDSISGDSIWVRSNYFFLTLAPFETRTLSLILETSVSVDVWFTSPDTIASLSFPLVDTTFQPTLLMAKASLFGKNFRDSYCCVKEGVECVVNFTANMLDITSTISSIIPGAQGAAVALGVSSCIASVINATLPVFDKVYCNGIGEDVEIDELLIKTTPSVIGAALSCMSSHLTGLSRLKYLKESIREVYSQLSLILSTGTVFLDQGMSPDYNCFAKFRDRRPDCPPIPPKGGKSTPYIPVDPNEISGYIAESGSIAVGAEQMQLPYMIEFENDSTLATGMAHTVIVKDTLDGTVFDLNSFSASSFAIGDEVTSVNGGQSFTQTVDMRPDINVLAQVQLDYRIDSTFAVATWTFSSLDPMSLQPAVADTLGFLGIGGTGEVNFTINRKANLPDSTLIDNRAWITFDNEESIATSTWRNIIDATPPVSRIDSVTYIGDTAVVAITATDNLSGVWRHNVYAQLGNDVLLPVAMNVPADTVAVFIPPAGTVMLHPSAVDSAGNVERVVAIHPVYFDSLFVIVCDSFEWYDSTYTASGKYVRTRTSAYPGDFDTVTTLHLTVNHSNSATETATACESYFWDGQWLVASGLYVDTLTNAAGCDSIVTLILTINNPIHTAVTETACDSYTWNDAPLTTSGNYTYPHNDVNGCTQVDTLHLTINNPVHTETTETACESYTWNGTAYTALGNYTYSHTDANGCTQVDTLHLTINNPIHTSITEMACDSYTWNGTAYTASGNYTYNHTDANGCTQVDTLHLTVNYSTTGDTTATDCDSFSWWNTNYTNSTNTPAHVYTNAAGCDSTVTLHLTINNPVHTAVIVAACESYSWNNTVYTASGAYTYTHLDSNGCTQVDTLYLTITTPVMLEVYDTACDVYSWYGNAYTATGDYVRTRPSVLPELCDTVETLHLTINYSSETTITDTAEGSYTWNGETYTESGTYQWQGTTDAGCDSTVTLLLVVNSVGIEVIDGSGISVVVYPNPTTGWVTIDAEDILSVEVFDQAGHKVATYEQSNRINLGELAAGNYILRIHLQRGSSVQRVILK
ncbi:MAG: T9SS type A sorting domain-containing protein [Bacteroidales bacterium]|nr:T9SS type A sorting domain-containing protein [Bacteroidales bacterium]